MNRLLVSTLMLAALALAACQMPQQRQTVVSDVRTIAAPPTVIAGPCVDAKEIPEPFVSSMPANGDLRARAAGADADLSWLAPRYAKARAKLLECSQLPKEPPQ